MRLLSIGRTTSLCLLLGLAAGQAFGTTYYLSPTGSDANPGTATAPWQTLTKAATTVTAGDTVLLNDGDYVGGAIHSHSGTVSAPITYQAVHVGKAVVRGDLTTATDAFIVRNCSYVQVLGLTFYKANRAGVWVATTKHVTVRNCIGSNCATWGIFTSFSDDLDIEYNTCFNSVAQHGIYISNSGDRPIVRYNTCYNNARAGIQLNGDGSMLKPILGTQGDGIIDGAIVEWNILHDNGAVAAAAINLMSCRNGLFANNLLYNNKAGGIAGFDDNDGLAWGCKNNQFVFNTVYFRPTEGRWCLSLAHGSTGNTVMNNILWGGYRGSYQIDNSSDFTADCNVLRQKSDVGVATNQDTSTYYSFLKWKSFSGQDAHSAISDPRFVQPASAPFDFRLVAGSPAIDAGTQDPDVTVDLDGNPRVANALPDMGAYEGAHAPATPTGLAAVAGTTSASLSWQPSSTGATYTLRRALSPSGPFSTVASGLTGTSFTNTGLLTGTAYSYVVIATDGGMQSASSTVVTVSIP